MRQKIRQLGHQIDPPIWVFDADMHMHAADQHALHHALEVILQVLVPLFSRVGLVAPV